VAYLYIVRCNDLYKIGIATDIDSRLASLQTGNPYPLEVEQCFEFANSTSVEQVLHQRFSAKRKLGEWFSLTGADLLAVYSICVMLGGKVKQESPSEPTTGIQDKSDSEWRIEVINAGKYWTWRRG
jgi:hypothetical protein